MQRPCFHLSIPARDVATSADWYERVLGCRPGRRSPVAVILDLGGHQLVLQQHAGEDAKQPGIYPRHFGLVFDQPNDWEALRDRIAGLANRSAWSRSAATAASRSNTGPSSCRTPAATGWSSSTTATL